jgi:hypothetical protein
MQCVRSGGSRVREARRRGGPTARRRTCRRARRSRLCRTTPKGRRDGARTPPPLGRCSRGAPRTSLTLPSRIFLMATTSSVCAPHRVSARAALHAQAAQRARATHTRDGTHQSVLRLAHDAEGALSDDGALRIPRHAAQQRRHALLVCRRERGHGSGARRTCAKLSTPGLKGERAVCAVRTRGAAAARARHHMPRECLRAWGRPRRRAAAARARHSQQPVNVRTRARAAARGVAFASVRVLPETLTQRLRSQQRTRAPARASCAAYCARRGESLATSALVSAAVLCRVTTTASRRRARAARRVYT